MTPDMHGWKSQAQPLAFSTLSVRWWGEMVATRLILTKPSFACA